MIKNAYLKKYQDFVDFTTSQQSKDTRYFKDTIDLIREHRLPPERIITAAMGLSSESGEFAEIIKKIVFQGKPIEEETKFHLKRELGDILWYVCQACIALDTDLEEIIEMNINKLEDRYPGGFSEFNSNNRKEGDLWVIF